MPAELPTSTESYSKEEVAKHTVKGDCWVILHGRVLNVSNFLAQHPGGELAILTFAGKDATSEFDMIHPPDVVGKYVPDAVIGMVATQDPTKLRAGGSIRTPAVKVGPTNILPNHHAWGHLDGAENWRIQGIDTNPGVFLVNVQTYISMLWNLLLSVLYELCATIFTATNIKVTNDRVGLTRSAIFLLIFIIIHAVGNLHVFKGPDDFNGYGYFYVRLYWTGFGLPANIVEEYLMLSIVLHIMVGLKRTWDMKLKLVATSGINVLNLAITGLVLMTFMTVHLFQFRFGDTEQFGPYYIRPPPFLINFFGILSLNLFWTDDETIPKVGVRDIYALEFQIFRNPLWSYFYTFSVLIFVTHGILGWKKVVPVLVSKRYVTKAELVGVIMIAVLGLIYISFPVYVTFGSEYHGDEVSLQVPQDRVGL
mmetsp:Transcript_80463/g.186835  ORF Transcript_80463/g.186835 Transcript_80463/m.186835 type:complete len:423 (+) Transcript_80463:92-1360(+)|eukprot:CAMPEP_0171085058 /NCGR_PEP_ID=MMETSP0766_2-20121228/18705_1 /TAXON_ID=439317 /ORGANISM="Gambierdiscus australes, Strain CAWD 149" /LENGTH=422 /DNA_ID=CAMNT_0011542603 /DNA_START=90 /DNA_END=1358 /DNA_ORIENTATION=+